MLVDRRRGDFRVSAVVECVLLLVVMLLLVVWRNGTGGEGERPSFEEDVPRGRVDTDARGVRSLVYEDLVVG